MKLNPLKLTFALIAFTAWTVACNPGSTLSGSHQPASQPPSFEVHSSEIDLPVRSGGTTRARLWPGNANGQVPDAGLLFVSGVDGGFVEPVDGIYDRLATEFSKKGVTSIFVEYRDPGNLEPSVEDALSAYDELKRQGVKRLYVIGWSFGGAVIINTAVQIPEALGIIGFAAQSLDTEAAARFRTDQTVLLFHSQADENVPYYAAGQILDTLPAGVHSQLVSFENGDHLLEVMADRIDPKVRDWIMRGFLLN